MINHKRPETQPMRYIISHDAPLKGLAGIALLLLTGCTVNNTATTHYTCRDARSGIEHELVLSAESIEFSSSTRRWLLAPLQQTGAVTVVARTRPEIDDERVVTTQLFRFDADNGYTYLLEDGKITFQGDCTH